MNTQRKDHRDDMSAPHDAVANLVRATSEAMEAFMKTDLTKDNAKEEGVALNPLMTNPAIMMAAATAYGIRMTGQWASLFLNAMQDQAERANAQAPEPEVAEPQTVAEPAVAVVAETPVAETEFAAPVMEDLAEPVTEDLQVQEPVLAPMTSDDVIEKKARKAAKAAKVRKKAEKSVVADARAHSGDDLKRISGIGPKLANVLAGHGVVTFAQLAEMDEAALAALDAELGLEGRIVRDDWAGQARALSAVAS